MGAREHVMEEEGEGWRKGEIRNVEQMSVAGKTKHGRLCTAFCFAESAAEHGKRRG